MYTGQNVHRTKCTQDKIQLVYHRTKCTQDKMYTSQNTASLLQQIGACTFGSIQHFSFLSPSPRAKCTGLENRRSLFLSQAGSIFLPRVDDSQCDWIHFCLIAVHCFDKSSLCLGKNIVQSNG